jgi:hypothetical protein
VGTKGVENGYSVRVRWVAHEQEGLPLYEIADEILTDARGCRGSELN